MLNLSSKKIRTNLADEHLSSLQVLQTPRFGKILARWMVGLFLIILVVLFLPWQQNINGVGSLTALDPADRPQTIQSAIAGRIEAWHIREGQYVNKGDTILRLSEIKEKFFDPDLLLRIGEQIDAKESTIGAKRQKSEALGDQVIALEGALQLKLAQARNKLEQARLKVISDSADLVAQRVQFQIAQEQLQRQQNLYEKGLKSRTELETRTLNFQQNAAKIMAQENKYLASQNELINARIDLSGIEAEYREKISKARSDLSGTLSEVYTSAGELSKLENEFVNMQIRNSNYYIVAPQNGYIVRAQRAGLGETIKEGESVVTIMPQYPEMAVAMYVRAMDVPLIQEGRKVRMEFDGWPALQFSGWPSVAVGTFGGIVRVIDFVETPERGNMYRVLVAPDPDEEPWPEQLRMGSGVYGWIMLDEVPIWYEIWRQLNGFPPSLQEAPDAAYNTKTIEK